MKHSQPSTLSKRAQRFNTDKLPRRKVNLAGVFLGLAALSAATGCMGSEADAPLAPRASFETYHLKTVEQLLARRAFQSQDRASELVWNAPGEWRPQGQPRRGVLLVHGLGDSPWTFHDLAARLAAQGYLVRTVLLAGHGTRPEDMLHVRLEDWRRTVEEQAQALRDEVNEVWLGGFSTGANLALAHAYENPAVAGLLLFSPAFEAKNPFDWLTPWISWARPWLLQPTPTIPMQNEVRYMLVPTNGFAQFYRSSSRARRALQRATYDKPVLIVAAEHDSVVDTTHLARSFHTRFTHPASRLVWYGTEPAAAQGDPRLLVRPDRLPEWRISQFSHMGLMFAPDNPLYGKDGRMRICLNGQADDAAAACEKGSPVWFSDWGYQEAGKVHARLTFNPYFEWQSGILQEVLAGSRRASAITQAAPKQTEQRRPS